MIINKKRPSSNTEKLQVNDENFEQPFSISNAINKYFCGVPANLACSQTAQIKSPFLFLHAEEKRIVSVY